MPVRTAPGAAAVSAGEAFGDAAVALIRGTLTAQREQLHTASAWIADAIVAGGLLRVFGTGHSRLLAEEIFYRAGSLAPIDAILDDDVSGYRDVSKSELAERVEGLGEIIVAHRRLAPPDLLLVISQSGRNAVPVEVAIAAAQRRVRTIAICSLRHAAGQSSRHSSGKHLHEVADLVIDNGVPEGDCAIRLPNGMPMGPLSGVVGAVLVHTLIVQTAAQLLARGIDPPVFRSGNVDGGREVNEQLLARYWGRIPGW
ncbi:MAG TPA: SIS domain-containing protein [Candidatus Sulfotelmatobacter sp.]|nr:SIS domain-containing protein [Candidatus Sulfotelmatobacter sp.]